CPVPAQDATDGHQQATAQQAALAPSSILSQQHGSVPLDGAPRTWRETRAAPCPRRFALPHDLTAQRRRSFTRAGFAASTWALANRSASCSEQKSCTD